MAVAARYTSRFIDVSDSRLGVTPVVTPCSATYEKDPGAQASMHTHQRISCGRSPRGDDAGRVGATHTRGVAPPAQHVLLLGRQKTAGQQLVVHPFLRGRGPKCDSMAAAEVSGAAQAGRGGSANRGAGRGGGDETAAGSVSRSGSKRQQGRHLRFGAHVVHHLPKVAVFAGGGVEEAAPCIQLHTSAGAAARRTVDGACAHRQGREG